MLVYFKVGNYKSIKDPIVLNFNPASINEHQESNIIQEDDYPMLKALLLYGRNASGKSKLLDALTYFRLCILQSVDESFWVFVVPEAFALSETTERKPSFFEICFVLDKIKYRYGFEADEKRIHKEWLLEAKSPTGKDFPVFMRIGNEFEVDEKRFPNAAELDKRTRENALFLTVASQWHVEKAEKINHWIRSIMIISEFPGPTISRFTVRMLQDERYAALIKEFITKADLDIFDLGITEFATETDIKGEEAFFEKQRRQMDRDEKSVYTLHVKYNEKNEVVGTIPFFLTIHESAGTLKYFNIIGPLVSALFNNQLVVMDEFGESLHPLLTKAILKLFNSNRIKSKAQLLVASHDTALLDRNILRRDQIGFVEKDQFGATGITSLVEFKSRKESPYDKNYLEGKYGAIPIIEELEALLANGEDK